MRISSIVLVLLLGLLVVLSTLPVVVQAPWVMARQATLDGEQTASFGRIGLQSANTGAAELTIRAAVPPDAPPDAYITYELEAANVGEDYARGVVVTTTLPSAISPVGSALPSGLTATDNQVIWSVGRLAPDAPPQRTWFAAHITHTLAYGTVLTATFEIAGSGPAGRRTTNMAQASTRVGVPARRVAVPSLKTEDDWETSIMVQNLGRAQVRGVGFFWGEPAECELAAAAPIGVDATGPLASCAGWPLAGPQLPDGARSALIYAVSEDQVAEAIADATDAVGDFAAWQAWEQRWADGAYGFGAPLGVVVEHWKPHPVNPQDHMAAAYTGIAGMPHRLGELQDTEYIYAVPLLLMGPGGRTTTLSIQNTGSECTTPSLSFRGSATDIATTQIGSIAPGSVFTFDPAQEPMFGPGKGVVIRSDQPLGIVATDVDPDRGLAAAFPALSVPQGTGGGTSSEPSIDTLYAPVAFKSDDGWNSQISVQNVSPDINAKVRWEFLSVAGEMLASIVDWFAPMQTATVDTSLLAGIPENTVFSIRVESEAWSEPGSDSVFQPPIAGTVRLVNTDRGQSAAYAMSQWSSGAPFVRPLKFGLPHLDDQAAIYVRRSNHGVGSTSWRFDFCDQTGLFELLCMTVVDDGVIPSLLGDWSFLDGVGSLSGSFTLLPSVLSSADQDRSPSLATVVFNQKRRIRAGEEPLEAARAYQPVPLAFSYVRPPADPDACPLPATPEPTFTPTTTPTATATPIASDTPTSTATPSATMTPTATLAPTRSPTPTSTATPTQFPEWHQYLPFVKRTQ